MELRLFSRSLSVLLVITLCSVAIAQQRTLTPEMILGIRTIVDVQLSPDGERVVFQVSRTRTAAEKPGPSLSEIWMVPARGGEPIRFTYNDKSDRAPAWSPDGTQMAFLSERGDASSNQVFLIRVGGGEAMQLTNAENSVSSFKWSPDGSRIAYVVRDPKTRDEIEAEKEGKDWVVADQNYKQSRLYTIEIKSRASKPVSPSNMTVQDYDWSPDGKSFVVGMTDTPTVDDAFMRVKLMTLPAEGGEPKLVTPTEGKLTHPRWSPDGKWIAWLGATSMNDPYAGSVFTIPAGGGTKENRLQDYDGTANWLGWQPGKPATVVFRSIERQQTAIYAMPLPGATRTELSDRGVIHFSEPSFNRAGTVIAIAANTPRHPNEVFFGEVGQPLKRLTHFNRQLNDLALGDQEVIKWKSSDGWEIEGVLVKPVGYQRGTRYPTVLQAHGGPESADLNGWLGSYSRWGQMLAGRGFVTLYPNYRGSIGRGVAFSKADHRDLMGKEFEDMLAGIDHLIREGITDGDRVGVGGGSYGGYTSAWAATFASERFKAAVAWMGISNWYSMTGTSDIFLENSTVHWDAIMYENYELYLERSPIRHINKANTPTLIVHGSEDPRVPPGQSLELYTALKWKGVPVEFVTYPREGHGVGERAHQLDFMNRVLGWFDRYLRAGENSR